MHNVVAVLFFCVSACAPLMAQGTPKAGQPIILEWADSLQGIGSPTEGIREFIGNVRFSHGNVTVSCQRAIQSPSTNTVDLFGNVVVKQENLTLTTSQASYNGNSRMATAQGGLRIVDGRRTITSVNGTYSTATHQATFDSSVASSDDTVLAWSNHAHYNRDSRETRAWGNVVAWDTVSLARLQCDSMVYYPDSSLFNLFGDAAIWDWDHSLRDTIYMVADTVIRRGGQHENLIVKGSAAVLGRNVAGRADTILYNGKTDTIVLYHDPVLWTDSTELLADTITLFAPARKLKRVVGNGNAILVSRQDTTSPNRYDQIAGETVEIAVRLDTIRQITATNAARSITYRMEDGRGEGLASFASDTIKAVFDQGALVDVFWLGGIEGEHQPEHLVFGKEANYLLPNFEWRTDKPLPQPLPSAGSSRPYRTPVRIKAGLPTDN